MIDVIESEVISIITKAIDLQARDIHFFWSVGRIEIIYRTGINVDRYHFIHLSMYKLILKYIKKNAKLKQVNFCMIDGTITFIINQKKVDFKVDILIDRKHEHLILRKVIDSPLKVIE